MVYKKCLFFANFHYIESFRIDNFISLLILGESRTHWKGSTAEFDPIGIISVGHHSLPHHDIESMDDNASRVRGKTADEIRIGDVSADKQKHSSKRLQLLSNLINPEEKLSEGFLLGKPPTIWTALPNLPGLKTVNQIQRDNLWDNSDQVFSDIKSPSTQSPKYVREIAKKKTSTPPQKVVPPSVSSRVVYFPGRGSNELDKVQFSREGFHKVNLNMAEVGTETDNLSKIELGRVSSLISKSAREFEVKKRLEGSPYR